mmetsp:Transcript_8708/g.13458  ORF Transcript_8708/g.13458 Transcript_8708/m.13458 type:complete len:366 (+) Transcript_8708:921-2018(+)
MHEIGHNLGLTHANQGDEYSDDAQYQDYSSVMGGFTGGGPDGPRMCFNGPQNWQLGWYADREIEVDPFATPHWKGRLVGVVDYENASPTDYVTIRLNSGMIGNDYYIAFNRQASFNIEVPEGGDQVLLTSRLSGVPAISTSPTFLLDTMDEGDSYEIIDFAGQMDITIQVERINFVAVPPFAELSINASSEEATRYPTPTPPECKYDDPCDAQEAEIGGPPVVVDLAGCTAERRQDVPTRTGEIEFSSWISFVAPDTGCIQIDYDYVSGNNYDAEMWIFESESGCDTFPFKELAFNFWDEYWDDQVQVYDPLITLTDGSLVPGRTYYVAVDVWWPQGASVGNVTFGDPCYCNIVCRLRSFLRKFF